MCLIVVREPNITVPFDKLSTACSVNPDGWGLIVNDRGKSEVIKQFSPKGNDPDAIAKLMDEAKDARVALHLRYATHGDKNLDNTHPFQTLNQQEHGIDLHFMHNGVLSDFGKYTDKTSDTHNFNERVLKRMMQDSLMHYGDQWVSDKYVETVLTSLAGSSNKFVLFDNTGQVMIINRKAGQDYGGWWASNVYSFRATHRGATSAYKSTWERDENGQWYDTAEDHKPKSVTYLPRTPATTTPAAANSSTKEDDTDTIEVLGEKLDISDVEYVKEAFAQVKDDDRTGLSFMTEYRPTFCELTGIDSLEECTKLTPSDIGELVLEYPQMAAVLLMDLLYAIYINDPEEAE